MTGTSKIAPPVMRVMTSFSIRTTALVVLFNPASILILSPILPVSLHQCNPKSLMLLAVYQVHLYSPRNKEHFLYTHCSMSHLTGPALHPLQTSLTVLSFGIYLPSLQKYTVKLLKNCSRSHYELLGHSSDF